METTSMFEIGIAKFEEIMKTGRVMGLELAKIMDRTYRVD
jgi:hypothetical protein